MVETRDPQYIDNGVFGYFTWPEFYQDMVNKFTDGSTFVEVGTLEGKSLIYLIRKIIESKKKIEVFAVDCFCGISEYSRDNFEKNTKSLKDYFTLIPGYSKNVAKMFDNDSLDFVFIDACHEYKCVRDDICAWLPKVKSGGVIAGHDYIPTYPGVMKAVDKKFGNKVNKSYAHEGCWYYEI